MSTLSLWTRHDPFETLEAFLRHTFGPVPTRPTSRPQRPIGMVTTRSSGSSYPGWTSQRTSRSKSRTANWSCTVSVATSGPSRRAAVACASCGTGRSAGRSPCWRM